MAVPDVMCAWKIELSSSSPAVVRAQLCYYEKNGGLSFHVDGVLVAAFPAGSWRVCMRIEP